MSSARIEEIEPMTRRLFQFVTAQLEAGMDEAELGSPSSSPSSATTTRTPSSVSFSSCPP